jgi:hypothetical protein
MDDFFISYVNLLVVNVVNLIVLVVYYQTTQSSWHPERLMRSPLRRQSSQERHRGSFDSVQDSSEIEA